MWAPTNNAHSMIKKTLRQAIQHAVAKAFPEVKEVPVVIEYPSDPSHGDYACPTAMQLAKMVKQPPRAVAERLMEVLEVPEWLKSIEIAGPGFLNFFMRPEFLVGEVRGIVDQGGAFGRNETGAGKKVLIEYSSPNTNKPLHLGHARNNVLGMATANLLEANGYEVVRTQIVNDRGIHICKSMLAYQKFGRNTSPESVGKKGDHFVGDYYVKYNEALKEDPGIEEEVKVMLRAWEAGDPEIRALWKTMNEWVWAGFTETYEVIGSHFDTTTFESDISEAGRALVEKALEEGKAETIEGGAVAIDLSDCGLGDSETGKKVLIRSDGTTVYMTQDLQLAVQRMDGTEAHELIYVVGNEQDYHFKVLFEVLKRFGYAWAERCFHLSYGMVTLPSGKLKSREGTAVDIDTLVGELESLVDHEIAERQLPYEGTERQHLVRAVAMAALKYHLLKVDAKSSLLYDPASSIDFQGNTGPYLQYTHARFKSILRKVPAESVDELRREVVSAESLSTEEESALVRKLGIYPEVVAECVEGFRLHRLAEYLNELAQLANRFYVQHPVLDGTTPKQRTARLQLVTAVAQVLKNGLAILGIEAVEKM